MTEQEWLACEDPQAMLEFFRGRLSERRLRLFACACCRGLPDTITPEKTRWVIDVAERYAGGLARGDERKKAWRWARDTAQESEQLAWEASGGWGGALQVHALAATLAAVALTLPGETARAIERAGRAVVGMDTIPWGWWAGGVGSVAPARDVLGDPFRTTPLHPACLTPTVVSLARAGYDECTLPGGVLDPVRLSILGDALEDAGCTDADLLGHLRGPGPHVRGCRALDLILGRS